jgi:trehalose/maltose hydrolase-like predicted phosphorylase
VSAWTYRLEGFVAGEEGRRESLCTLGNGYLATRGAMPESTADGAHYPGTYVAGTYNRLADVVDGHRIVNESLVNLPNWLVTALQIDGGAWLDLARDEVVEHWQQLDLREGILLRHTRLRDPAGRTTRIVQRRLVSMDRPHVAALETTVTAEDWSGRLTVRSGLDGTVRNAGVARYRDLAGTHLGPLSSQCLDEESVLLVVETTQSGIRVAEAARTRVLAPHATDAVREVVRERGWVGHDISVELSPGQDVTLEKVVAIFTSRDRAISEPAEAAVEELAAVDGFDGLRVRHAQAWAALWRSWRVELPQHDGALGVIRLHLFHLLQTVSPSTVDLDVGVPARGLHGEAYRGHVFWDELFVLPLINLRLPALARSLLRYRSRRLPAARRAAQDAGLGGAMFPWQSGSDGREESQRLHLNPRSGRWLPDATSRQRHINVAVAFNVWQYYQATGDDYFLSATGAGMLLEAAQLLADLAYDDPATGRYSIRGVVGPDEFHTGYPDGPETGVDDNAYTNVMTAWVLQRALEVMGRLPSRRCEELVEQLRLRPRDVDRWRDITHRMTVPFHADGVISQFAGYEQLAELDWAGYRERYGDLQRLDRILDAEGDYVNRYQVSKQADVLMLFYLLSAEELREVLGRLGYVLAPRAIPATIDHYLARTTHGSTLSAVVHAWVLARAHREHALDYFVRALESDTADIQGGTTSEGIHLGAMSGSVDIVQRCFAGVETSHDVLWVNPHWPHSLGPLVLDLTYRGQELTLNVTGTSVTVRAAAGPGAPIRCGSRSTVVTLNPGETVQLGRHAERHHEGTP